MVNMMIESGMFHHIDDHYNQGLPGGSVVKYLLTKPQLNEFYLKDPTGPEGIGSAS